MEMKSYWILDQKFEPKHPDLKHSFPQLPPFGVHYFSISLFVHAYQFISVYNLFNDKIKEVHHQKSEIHLRNMSLQSGKWGYAFGS